MRPRVRRRWHSFLRCSAVPTCWWQGMHGCNSFVSLSLPCCTVLRRVRWLTQPHSIASTSLHHLLPPASEWPAMHLAMQSPTTAMRRQELTTPTPLGPCLHMQGYCSSNVCRAFSTPRFCSSMWRQQQLCSRRWPLPCARCCTTPRPSRMCSARRAAQLPARWWPCCGALRCPNCCALCCPCCGAQHWPSAGAPWSWSLWSASPRDGASLSMHLHWQ